MNCIITFVKTFLLGIVLIFLAGCSDDEVIGKKTMVAIVRDMYLADQYISITPQLRAQTDSMTVYPSIVAKYGYTMEDYKNSLSYYLQKDDSYNQILKSVKKELEEKIDILDYEIAKIQKLRRGPEKWWALDSVRRGSTKELVFDPVLRGVRWIVIPGEKLEKWRFIDSAIVDIPQNSQWWINNMEIPLERDHIQFFYKDFGKVKADSIAAIGKGKKIFKELEREGAPKPDKLRKQIPTDEMVEKEVTLQ